MNPVTLKELRGRMRGARAFVVLTVYLALLAGFALTLYVLYVASFDAGLHSGQNGAFGRTLFLGVLAIELFLITFIVPAFTAGAITGERERQTYDLLRTTLIKPRALVLGKLISALAYVFLLLLAAIPLQSLAFLFGGVGFEELALSFVVLLVTAVFIGTVGLFFSAGQRRTLGASVATYGIGLFITLGLPLMLLIFLAIVGPFVLGLTNANPPLELRAVLTYVIGGLICTNPLAAGFVSQALLSDQGQIGFFTQTYSANGAVVTLPLVSPWIVFSLLYLILSAVLLRATIRRVARIDTNDDALTYLKKKDRGAQS
jgi:ABC-type transport system involved in multi-copper enzyme maturation permease subunit